MMQKRRVCCVWEERSISWRCLSRLFSASFFFFFFFYPGLQKLAGLRLVIGVDINAAHLARRAEEPTVSVRPTLFGLFVRLEQDTLPVGLAGCLQSAARSRAGLRELTEAGKKPRGANTASQQQQLAALLASDHDDELMQLCCWHLKPHRREPVWRHVSVCVLGSRFKKSVPRGERSSARRCGWSKYYYEPGLQQNPGTPGNAAPPRSSFDHAG